MRTHNWRAWGVAAVMAVMVVSSVACSASATKEEPLPAVLHEPVTEPTTATAAVRDAELLLRDIRLHLSAMTGEQAGVPHPVLQKLEAEAETIREGVRALRLEMNMNGLDFQQTMQPFLDALNHHYLVLEQIRDHLAKLEMQRSPADTQTWLANADGTITPAEKPASAVTSDAAGTPETSPESGATQPPTSSSGTATEATEPRE